MSQFDERLTTRLEFFGRAQDPTLPASEPPKFELDEEVAKGLARFNIEWHFIPSADELPLDDA